MNAQAAASPRTRALLLVAPVGAALLFALVQYFVQRPARLGDDWIYFHSFQHMPLYDADGVCALTQNGSPADGLRFRPFCYAVLWLEQQLSGLFDVSWFAGVAWIASAGVFLNLWLRALGVHVTRAALAAALFCLAPGHAEVWAWATARIDTMACALGLAGLWALARRRPLLAFTAFVAAFASKESAYPLAVLAPLVPLVRARGLRAALRDAALAFGALASVLIAKQLVLGQVFADSWSRAFEAIPLSMMISGWFSQLSPLLFDPVSTAAEGPALRLGGALFFALLVLALAVPVVVFATHPRRKRLADAARLRRVAPVLALCVLAYFGTIAVSFGVTALPDLNGGRLYFLPSAFVLSAVAILGARVPLLVLLVLGTGLLHANLAPYRAASAEMLRVEARLALELEDSTRALRVRGLPKQLGPVPCFVLMAEHYAVGIPVPDASRSGEPASWPRVFLSWSDDSAPPAPNPELEAQWSAEMRRRGLTILRLSWQDGALRADD